MRDTVDYLPIWKKDATPEERFLEIAMIARKHPERFRQYLVIYQESVTVDGKEGLAFNTRYVSYGLDTMGALGLIELGKLNLLRFTHDF